MCSLSMQGFTTEGYLINMSTDDNDNFTPTGHYRECYMMGKQYKEQTVRSEKRFTQNLGVYNGNLGQ